MQIISACLGTFNLYPSFSNKRNLPFFFGPFIFICFFSFSNFTQGASKPVLDNPRLSHLNTSDGVRQHTIHDLHTDSYGYLWIANDEGLNRYDSQRLIQITCIYGDFLNNRVYDIYEDISYTL